MIETPILLAALVSFVAGAIDAMAGGGGVFTMPTIATFPLTIAHVGGTNKLVGTCGSLAATIRFLRRGKIHRPTALLGGACAMAGAVLGALALARLGASQEPLVRRLFGGLLVAVALYVALRPSLGRESGFLGATRRNLLVTAGSAFLIGGYDGFFGPGTGSLLAFVMIRLLRFDFVTGTGNAKALNFASNLASVTTFLAKGLVVWKIALPMGIANALGSHLGASLAIARGPALLRPVFLAMAAVVAARLLFG